MRANVWWSWYATDHSVFANLGSLPRQYLYLALVLVSDARRRAAHQRPDAEIRSRRTIVP
jgi:hypothetical protein